MTDLTSEIDLLHKTIKDHTFYLGPIEIEHIGNQGYAVHLTRHPVIHAAEWIFYDLDDTLVASWEAKERRIGNFITYCRSQGLELKEKDLLLIFQATDEYARWPEREETIYHFQAHVNGLGAAIELVVSNQSREFSDLFALIQEYLNNNPHGKLPHTPHAHAYSNDLMSKVFHVVVRPNIFTEVAESISTLRARGRNIGIFTYGEPHFQLLKTLTLLRAYKHESKSIDVSQIWLTKTTKGAFMQTMAQKMDDVRARKILLIDDNPAELNSVMAGMRDKKIDIAVMRSLRHGTKTTDHSWNHELEGHHIFDARTTSVSTDEFVMHIEQASEPTRS